MSSTLSKTDGSLFYEDGAEFGEGVEGIGGDAGGPGPDFGGEPGPNNGGEPGPDFGGDSNAGDTLNSELDSIRAKLASLEAMQEEKLAALEEKHEEKMASLREELTAQIDTLSGQIGKLHLFQFYHLF